MSTEIRQCFPVLTEEEAGRVFAGTMYHFLISARKEQGDI